MVLLLDIIIFGISYILILSITKIFFNLYFDIIFYLEKSINLLLKL